jgi:hypothetical protein
MSLRPTRGLATVCGRVVPGEGLEPPTFGLQNRCTTAVLTRQTNLLANPITELRPRIRPVPPSGAVRSPGVDTTGCRFLQPGNWVDTSRCRDRD